MDGHGTPSRSTASLPEGLRSCRVALGSWTLHSSLGQYHQGHSAQEPFRKLHNIHCHLLPLKFHELSDCHSISLGWLFGNKREESKQNEVVYDQIMLSDLQYRLLKISRTVTCQYQYGFYGSPDLKYLSAWKRWHVMHEARRCNSTSWNGSSGSMTTKTIENLWKVFTQVQS